MREAGSEIPTIREIKTERENLGQRLKDRVREIADKGKTWVTVGAVATGLYLGIPKIYEQVVDTGGRRYIRVEAVGKDPISEFEEKATESATREISKIEKNGDLIIAYDQDGLPFFWQKEGGFENFWDKEMIVKLQQRAIMSGKPVVIGTMISRGSDTNRPREPQGYTEAKPKISQLPEDVVPEDVLKERGITIIQPERSKFFIRETEFEEGGLFEAYKEGGKNNLKICFIDAPMITPSSVADSKYDDVRKLVTKLLGKIDKGYVEQFRASQIEIIDKMARENSSNEAYWTGVYAAKRHLFETMPSDELAEWLPIIDPESSGGDEYGGLFFPKKSVKKVLEIENTGILFAAVGRLDMVYANALVVGADGKFTLVQSRLVDGTVGKDLSSRAYQTHPDLDDYRIDPDLEQMYPVVSQLATGPQVFGHEMQHDLMMDINPTGDKEEDSSERKTDLRALKRITDAYWQWVMSDYTDNSKYGLVFMIPEEFWEEEGVPEYILTQTEGDELV